MMVILSFMNRAWNSPQAYAAQSAATNRCAPEKKGAPGITSLICTGHWRRQLEAPEGSGVSFTASSPPSMPSKRIADTGHTGRQFPSPSQ